MSFSSKENLSCSYQDILLNNCNHHLIQSQNIADSINMLQVGDGTTSVTLLAGEFLKEAKPFIEEKVHPQVIIRAFRRATTEVKNIWKRIGNHFLLTLWKYDPQGPDEIENAQRGSY